MLSGGQFGSGMGFGAQNIGSNYGNSAQSGMNQGPGNSMIPQATNTNLMSTAFSSGAFGGFATNESQQQNQGGGGNEKINLFDMGGGGLGNGQGAQLDIFSNTQNNMTTPVKQ